MSRPSHAWTMLLAAAGLAGLTAFSVAGPQDSEPTKAQKINPPEWSKQFTALSVRGTCAVEYTSEKTGKSAKIGIVDGAFTRPMPAGYTMGKTADNACKILGPDNDVCILRSGKEPNCFRRPSKPAGGASGPQ